ncbi:MAG: hypothetical protein LAT55_12890 [Opitutales bacterium]|nr:hypothetical protein [Opitutales bacterium]
MPVSPSNQSDKKSETLDPAAAREGLVIFIVVALIFVSSWFVAGALGYFEKFGANFTIAFFVIEISILAILFYFLYWRKRS